MPTHFGGALEGDQPAKEARLIPMNVLLKGNLSDPVSLSAGYIFIRLSGDPHFLSPPTLHTIAQHLGLMQTRIFSPVMPQSLFTASWSPVSFDVRQAWTRADLQLTNNTHTPKASLWGHIKLAPDMPPSAVPLVPPESSMFGRKGSQ